ncbi:MAG: hypothetical protein H6709_13275 [Kofleriaceae bacterium]|nr:hypothetical protein [Kofleriaceae bacterium]MCB9573049.1 hypothetical protein [Kofleriaceae bacterium]
MITALVLAVLVVIALALGRATWIVTGWADVAATPGHAHDDAGAVTAAGDDDAPDAGPARGAPALIRRGGRPAVVLVHGILGFDAVGVGPVRVEYFRRVAARLDAVGFDVITARLPPLGPVPARAAALAARIAALPHDRVRLIAHSMGGLDARWALTDPAIAARVDELVTIGTPHHGTPIADLLTRGAPDLARAVVGKLGLPSPAVEWLTTARLASFNRDVRDAPGVRYASIVTATADRGRVHPLLWLPHAYLARVAGPSDGLVPAASQRWGALRAETERDHWAQVGWSGGHDAAELLLTALGHGATALPAASTG